MVMEAAGRLPHALLLRGPEGVGKYQFGCRLLAAMLCEGQEREHRPCGECRSCRLIAAGSHPDLHELLPLDGKQQIGIDQVRDLIQRIVEEYLDAVERLEGLQPE
jgi:DNA polymerase-3 subunit delta'